MKSVRARILTIVCVLVAGSLVSLGLTTILLNNWATRKMLEQTMTETAKVAAEMVSNRLNSYMIVVETAGLDHTLSDPEVSLEEKQVVVNNLCDKYADLTRGNILDATGRSIFDGQMFDDREYFKESMKGNTWVSDPVVSKITGKASIIVSAPIWQNGDYGSTVVGVVYFVPTETFLNDIVKSVKLSPGAGSVIINKSGSVIAHAREDMLGSNAQENVKTDPSMKPIADLEREMMNGKIGFGTYTMSGVEKFMGFAPIAKTNGWSMNVNAPTNDFMESTNISIIVTAVLTVVFLILSILLALKLANGIGKPLKFLSNELIHIAETGDIKISEESKDRTKRYLKRQDEVGDITKATIGLVEMLEMESNELLAVADGDLTTSVAVLSPNDTLGNAINKMVGSLNAMFSDISSASKQVSTGAKQIADGSQSLAQGSTQQAAAVEQLSSSISMIADKTSHNASIAKDAAALSASIKGNAEKGSEQMSHMMQAVKEINEASQSISKVIAVIDSIAFQTNILALNAAVEAARAGQHGKGFAVVAEEVRNLATKSAEAAKNTSSLIANSTEKAELGAKIAESTAASLNEIVVGIQKSSEIVEEIARSSEEQATSISEINRGIEQVANVVQQNSATSEQSAAASHEMSDQSNVLQELLSQFRIREESSAAQRRRLSDTSRHF